MGNKRNDHNVPLFPQPSRLDKLESSLSSTIDLVLALHAILVAKGLATHEEIDRMAGIVKDARPKLSGEFSVEEGIKAIVVAFRIEGGGK